MATELQNKVESYQEVASFGSFSGGSRNLWASSVVGTAIGAAIGVVAPFFPLVAGASSVAIATSAIPVSMAAFSALGMAAGFSSGALVGRVSGSNAAVAKEQEKRIKEWTARQILHQNPNAKIVADPPKAPEPEKSFWQRAKDTYLTYVNPRVGLALAAIGVVGGLIMAAAFIATGGAGGTIVPELGKLTGLGAKAFTLDAVKAAPGAFIAYTAGVMGAFGATFTLNVPKLAFQTSEFFGDLISGKSLGREWGPKPEKVPEAAMAKETPAMEMPQTQLTMRKYESYQELIAHRAAEPDAGLLLKR